jgi:hypothetical protein
VYDKLWRDLEKVYAEEKEVLVQCQKTNGRVRWTIEFTDPAQANRFEEKLNALRRVFRPAKGVEIRVAGPEE